MDERDTNTVAHGPRSRDILCVYSQADESFYLRLKKSMNLWERQGHVRWLELRPGDELAATGLRHVKRADLILLLLSPDFFPDELCYQTMHLALQERASRQVPIVPILVRAVNWRLSACKDLAIVPRNEEPIASWTLPDEAYATICADLTHLVPALQMGDASLLVRPRLFQARDLPKGYIPRPKAFDEIKYQLLHRQGNQTTAITTALRGAGGFGKTTLALALCHDPEIQAAFPDGILWVELGEQPPHALDILNGLLVSLEAPHHGAITLKEARERWRRALQDRICLLVIDDVWQAETLLLLLEGGPQCVRLVTTRNDLLLPKDAARVLLDAMEPCEAITLLCQDLPEEISRSTYQPQLERLVGCLGCWPLLLTLARGMLTDLVEYGLSISEALATVANAYQTRGVTAFRLDNVEERQRTVEACLKVSLQHLEQFTPPHYHATERYQELAVFPEDTDIPLVTLQVCWKGSAGLELWETKDLCMRLHRLSLLLSCDLGSGILRLHDVVRSYLIQCAGSHLPLLHVRLLGAYQQEYHLTCWSELPQSQQYLWQRLIFHLCQAGQRDILQTTLTDSIFLARKILYVGISALQSDLLFASTVFQAETEEQAVSFFVLLRRCVGHLRHLLLQAQTEAEIGGILLSYIDWEANFPAQMLSLEQSTPRPFLAAWHPLPNKLSSALSLTLHGHTKAIYACAVSPDNRFVVSASADHTLKVWDAVTGEERFTLKGHTDVTRCCVVSPDSCFIISSSNDRTLKVWDVITGKERLTLKGHTGWATSCAVSPTGQWIVSASTDKTLKMWDVATGVESLTLRGHTSGVYGCTISPDGRSIVSASHDKTLKVWDAATGEERLTLRGHTDDIYACAVSPDGQWIVSAADDNTLKVWDAATGEERLTLRGHTDLVSSCAVSPDGRFIVSASWDKTLKIWDVTTGTQLLTLFGHTSKISGCAMSPNGRFIVSSSWNDDKTLKIWDISTGITHLSAKLDSSVVVSAPKDQLTKWGERMSPSERKRWYITENPNERLINYEMLEERTITDRSPERFMYCAISPNGHILVSSSNKRTLRTWNVSTGTENLTLSGHKDMVFDCAVSPDSHFVVSASADRTLKVWNIITGAECWTLSGHTNWVYGCAVSPDGRWIISASGDCTLKVWDFATGEKHLSLTGHTDKIFGCAVSPDSQWLVSASADHTLKVWNVATGAQLFTLAGHTNIVNNCVVSPDGHFIVSASQDKTLKIWDAITGVERFTFSGHTSEVSNCAVSPDSRRVISVSNDCTVKVWNAETGQCILTFPVDGALYGCAFHPDGEHLVACGAQGMHFLRLVV